MPVVEFFYVLCGVLLSLYGLNSLMLTGIYLLRRRDISPEPLSPAEWPRVTVQLPIYNELHTAERLLTAVAGLDYPRDRLEIQALDDSTDATRELVTKVVERLRQQGVDIVHITRHDRAGFKAGALTMGLVQAKGELVAIFDADFLPPADFLKRLVPYFSDTAVGFIQTRWGHVNRDYSTLTQTEALGMDGHFVVEQTARNRAGLFINFNGTAGIWRRDCIDDAGGWTGDTLTEDLDLSYRAQLRGWRATYLPDVVVPSELPPQIAAFKRQQARWAQGSIQTALKLIPPLLRSRQPWPVKLEGVVHLTGYLVHPLMLMMILLAFPMSFSHSWVLMAAPWLMLTALGPPLMYSVTQVTIAKEWRRRLLNLPLLVMLGIGVCLNNTAAVVRAVFGVHVDFERTPKFDLRRSGETWVGSIYALGGDWLIWGELALAVLALSLLAVPGVWWTFVPWILLYAASFAYVAGLGLYQARQLRRWQATASESGAPQAAPMSPVTIGGLSSDRMGPGRDAEGRPIPADVALLRRDPDIHGLDEAILRTIVYADVFDFPLTTAEVHRYLIGHPASASDVEERLARSGGLRKRLGTVSPFWFLAGREDLASVRREREAFAKNLWPEALRYGRRVVSLPFVRLVALTGSLAMNNVKSPDDDIDLLIITQSGRIWLARGLIVLLVRQARQRSISLCPNYILSEHNLELSKPSLFVAHELAQMIPIHGSSRYQHLLDANSWLADFLPNASADMPVHATIRWTASLGRRGAEALLGGRLGDAVERWERERKIPRLRHEAAQLGGSGATFTPDLCKGHMADHATVVYRQYMAGLARQGL